MQAIALIGLAVVLIYLATKNNIIMNSSTNFDANKFSIALADSESGTGTGTGNGYNYFADNGFAYGKYQFEEQTLQDIAGQLGIATPTINEFKNDPALQEQFYNKLVSNNLSELKRLNLTSFIGFPITGKNNGITTTINIYGLQAGAWLGGVGGVDALLNHGQDRNDNPNNPAYGTYVSDYIAKFSNIVS